MARSPDAIWPLSLWRDKAFQLGQIKRLLWLTVAFVLQSTLILGVFYYQFLGSIVEGNAPMMFASEDLGPISEAVPSMGTVLAQWLIVMLVVNAVLMLVVAVYIVRKLGNPILAINRALNEIGDGNLNVRLRTTDQHEFSELCVSLNRALETVNGKILEAKEITEVVSGLPDQPAPDERELRESLEKCRGVLGFFADAPAVSSNDLNLLSANSRRR